MDSLFKHLSCLYVEDDPSSRSVMEVLLTKIMKVRSARILEDSQTFPTLLKTLPEVPDLVFLDVHVTPYDGYTMLKMIQAEPRWKQARVVALTASVMANEVENLRHAGFNSLIAKPLKADIFPQYIANILDGMPIWSVIWEDA